MAWSDTIFTGADLDVFRPEIWSQKINDFYRANLVCGSFFTDLSSDLSDGGDTINIPNLSEMTANVKVNQSQVTLNGPTETDVNLSVDTWYETSFLIEDREAKQVKHSYNLQERFAKNAAYTTAAVLEDALIALFSAFSQSVGASTTNLADSEIRKAIEYLDVANAPTEDRAFFLHPAVFWGDVQALDRFSLAINTAGADPIMKRPDAYLYGIPVYITSRIPYVSGTTGRVNALAHKDALVFASTDIRTQVNYIPEYLGTMVTADLLYGVVENRDTSGVRILTAA